MKTVLFSLSNFVPAVVVFSTSYNSLKGVRRRCYKWNRLLNARNIAIQYVFLGKKEELHFLGPIQTVPIAKVSCNPSNVLRGHQHYECWVKKHRTSYVFPGKKKFFFAFLILFLQL